jgi:hypothetical protein
LNKTSDPPFTVLHQDDLRYSKPAEEGEMITEGTMTLSSEEAIHRLFREVNDLKYRMEAHTALFSLFKSVLIKMGTINARQFHQALDDFRSQVDTLSLAPRTVEYILQELDDLQADSDTHRRSFIVIDGGRDDDGQAQE